MHIPRGDQRHPGGPGCPLPLVQSPAIAEAAMQLGHRVGSIEKDLAPSRQVRGQLAGRRRQDAEEQAVRVLGDIREGEAALALRRLPAAARQEPAEASITAPVHRP